MKPSSITEKQYNKLRMLVTGMIAAHSAYLAHAPGWKEKVCRDPFKSTRLRDFQRAAEAGKELLWELEHCAPVLQGEVEA